MSEVFDIYWQRKDKLSLSRVTENMCVKKVTLEEYIKLYNIAWMNEDTQNRSSERGCYIATKKFVTNYINALISESFIITAVVEARSSATSSRVVHKI